MLLPSRYGEESERANQSPHIEIADQAGRHCSLVRATRCRQNRVQKQSFRDRSKRAGGTRARTVSPSNRLRL
jgi:hypothetical protein